MNQVGIFSVISVKLPLCVSFPPLQLNKETMTLERRGGNDNSKHNLFTCSHGHLATALTVDLKTLNLSLKNPSFHPCCAPYFGKCHTPYDAGS